MKKLPTVSIPFTDLEVSAICYGTAPCGTELAGDEMDRVLDAYFERGGSFLDTAHCYACWLGQEGQGASERAIGEYVARRRMRERVVIATKGAHPPMAGYRDYGPYMSAECVRRDLDDSLSRLDMDRVDLYWLHRDDPTVPVAEIVDFMNEERKRGRIRYFGGSNWTAARIEEANVYAASKGSMGFVASQPCWNLAHRPPPEGDLRVLDDEDFATYERLGLPVIPYSAAAEGYFATAGRLGASFHNDVSAGRLARATSLANDLGVTPSRIALAWLLHQPFPVIPIIGTKKLDHLDDALDAVTVRLTPEQTRWLEEG
jgi:aryl-alcohol dehydrogenase-like predicted oxidoreductase